MCGSEFTVVPESRRIPRWEVTENSRLETEQVLRTKERASECLSNGFIVAAEVVENQVANWRTDGIETPFAVRDAIRLLDVNRVTVGECRERVVSIFA